MASTTATLKKFAESNKVRKDPSAVCKADSFVKAFKDYCKENTITLANPDEVTLDAIYQATGLTVERDTYRAYPGKNGSIHKSTWLVGASLVADDVHGLQLEVLNEFLDAKRGVFYFDTSVFMKYADFLKCLEAYCLQKRVSFFKPSARVLKEMCMRFNMALETAGVRAYGGADAVKGKWLLGVDFTSGQGTV